MTRRRRKKSKAAKVVMTILVVALLFVAGSKAFAVFEGAGGNPPNKKIVESEPSQTDKTGDSDNAQQPEESKGENSDTESKQPESGESDVPGQNAAGTKDGQKDKSSSKSSTTEKETSSTSSSKASGKDKTAYSDYALGKVTYVNAEGLNIIKEPNNLLVLVNKERSLPADYEPSDLVIPNVKFPEGKPKEVKQMRKPAAEALEKLFKGAEQDGIKLYAVSGYRSYNRQKSIFENYVKSENGNVAAANVYSAKPGQSEHQTGLAMDVSCASLGGGLDESFANTKEGKWLKENCAKYGFIIRFPKGKENITGYMYEPWHVRYVGEDIASEVMSRGITLEEYFNAVAVDNQSR